MREAVAPVTYEVGLEEAVLLGGDTIAELPRVADANLLIPTLCPDALFPLEGVDTVHTDGDVRQAHRDHRVRGGLAGIYRSRETEGGAGEVAAVVDGRVLRVLRRYTGIVERVQRVVVEGAGRIVDAGREGLVGVCLRILRVRPVDAEVTALGVVPSDIALPGLGGEVAEVEVPTIIIALAVVGARIHPPRTEAVPVARDRHIHIVIEGEVIPPFAQIETTLRLLPVLRHDDPRGVTLVEGEEAEGEPNGHRHIRQDKVGGPSYYVFLGASLPLGEHEVEVGMVVIVAGAVATILHIEAVIAQHLRALGRDIAFALLGDSPRDEALAGLEVVVQALGFVALTSVTELRIGRGLAHTVEDVVGVDEVAIEVEAHEVRIHPLVLIVHRAGAEEVGQALPDEHHRVLRLVGNDVIEALPLTATTLLACSFLTGELQAIGSGGLGKAVGLLQAIGKLPSSSLGAVSTGRVGKEGTQSVERTQRIGRRRYTRPDQGLLLDLSYTRGCLMSGSAGSEDDEGDDPQCYLLS